MTNPTRGWVSWSSGKDAAFALHTVRETRAVDVVGLLTTMNAATRRVPVHAVPHALVQAQADALGLPLHTVDLPWPCPNDIYEARTNEALTAAGRAGVERLVFGDLHLRDVREYRERSIADSGVAPMFPLWGRPTAELAAEMLRCGLRAVVTCVDPAQAPAELAGRWFDEAFLDGLPDGVDPCGERGEFHTFVVDGPGFTVPVDVAVGPPVERDGFVVAELAAR
ncbi:ATP-binding domain-containing protein [Pseudonocardia asaccharolytica]|uniref:ATPase n=1 Tax=Pseudonocardia asaccharolytica DSM 44247 = NBRC 16224 TaxID=1123024 RepID=A0A511D0M4_9PSEU|nr:ATP-binding domain-containing protein [Pseudonocardia asaccharolytica]GEL18359.1 ATPase [Pseudonocardia asaccharolytica DSM 44247 = NBRC 16224]